MTGLTPEEQEWVSELTDSWVAVYKKSATTLVLLQILREDGPASAGDLAPRFTRRTGWTVTERGLYRTLRRLADAGVLSIQKVDAPRTGAKRQELHLTPAGREYLTRIEAQLVADGGLSPRRA
ncbi:Transcriptional regulator PadR-like family protein [Kytococcus aerolatus]|uniref:Transcriptional regulator PadR-like family protein n=1 Tax=Kytococcus aerolatus TaxID=592308 RepID=A0A212T859_9MICO|nr:PadR family transcriptional regulator [Kytococcus aerolatus]SNC62247.1 Transcriptional regulator PadR-like family protein [Kytococcus aerolatus]